MGNFGETLCYSNISFAVSHTFPDFLSGKVKLQVMNRWIVVFHSWQYIYNIELVESNIIIYYNNSYIIEIVYFMK